ncbi:amino acid permease [Dongshaea marina]|uniref:amino acid permease n=1 Tax=Dongshaea marina TaxID=2047966 RepID=UPI00131EDBB9|nr:aromatic amino acid transport family protein [Dongshaea marina]
MKSKTLGASLIFTGNCVGAGILALPLSTAGLGFVATSIIITLCWLVSMLASLLIVEVLAAYPKKELNFDSMYLLTLGRGGQIIGMLAYVILLYSVAAAYMSGGASILTALLSQGGIKLPSWIAAVLFTLVLGGIVYRGHRAVDISNRLLLSTKGVSFIILAALLMPDVRASNLFDISHSMPYLWFAIPILFFSFGLQIMVPSMFSYLDRDTREIRKAIVIGSLVPLVIYLLWLVVMLGILPRFGSSSFSSFLANHTPNDIGDLFVMLGHRSTQHLSSTMMGLFTNVAVMTTFLSLTLALHDYMRDLCKLSKGRKGRNLSILITYLPPLLVSLFLPSLFQSALEYAAGLQALLLLIIPVAMVWSVRRRQDREGTEVLFRIPGGRGLLASLACFGAMLVVLGFMASLNMLPVLK